MAIDYIQQRILNGEYPMGYALNTKVLSEEIGISRTPVREALRRLEAKGLVEIVPHFGASVKSVHLSDYIEMGAMRQALEGYLAGTAAQVRTEADLIQIAEPIEAMRKLNEEMAASPEREKVLIEPTGREDIRFHVAIMSAARNKFITREVLRLHLISRVAISNAPVVPSGAEDSTQARKARIDRREHVHASHEEIFRAIRDRRPLAARELMERHIQEIIDSHIEKAGKAKAAEGRVPLTLEQSLYIAS